MGDGETHLRSPKVPSIRRLEAPDEDVGGVLVTWDDPGMQPASKYALWRSASQVDVPGTARRITEHLIEWARSEGHPALTSTNWVSLAAAVSKHIADWNALRASAPVIVH